MGDLVTLSPEYTNKLLANYTALCPPLGERLCRILQATFMDGAPANELPPRGKGLKALWMGPPPTREGIEGFMDGAPAIEGRD